MKRILESYWYFNRRERLTILVLLGICLTGLLLPYWFPEPVQPAVLPPEIRAYLAAPPDTVLPAKTASRDTALHRLFPFDPNTANADTWRAFGLPEKNIRTLLHYLEKGGRFREPADIRKIWGMPATLATRLIPYVRIPEQAVKNRPNNRPDYPYQTNPILDINTANPEAWEALPGIGKVLAERICRYRNSLGGFTGIEQVGGTYGLRDSVFQRILPQLRFHPETLPKIDLDMLDRYGFQHLFGLDRKMAGNLLDWREKHGGVLRRDDILAVPFLPDSTKARLLSRMRVVE
ncbi:MAG TPA: helix-hairpin-helix domain-containing protein [Sediminibacterium sp.]|nr:helix-hairpin-helix domain-containing protein [Sediminibacterium sp.]